MRNDVLVLFPGALGDLICFLPTLAALIRRHGDGLTLVTKPEWQPLLDLPGATLVSIDRREIADLFTADRALHEDTKALLGGRAYAYSWTGAGEPLFRQRLASIVADSVAILPFRGMVAGEHAVDYYARSAAVPPQPFAHLLRRDTAWLDDLQRRHDLAGRRLLVVHPGSGAPAKNWTGFAELAARWLRRQGDAVRLLILHGPAEAAVTDIAHLPGALPLHDLSLPQVAALLTACDLYAGNDSGISHLAGAVGAPGVVLFASTDVATWAPRGRLTVVHAPEECGRCGPRLFCTHRLSVERVEDTLGSHSLIRQNMAANERK